MKTSQTTYVHQCDQCQASGDSNLSLNSVYETDADDRSSCRHRLIGELCNKCFANLKATIKRGTQQ